ncbi:MAG: L-serine ammonia-lyase, iron-sulfur-dependent, subunit alpha [Faecalibacterium sp.]
MQESLYRAYLEILQTELAPAMGCTEPIAVAYAAAKARAVLGALPQSVQVKASGNIVKNVKSVIVPHTGGLKGITAATAAGIVAGNADKELEVLAAVTPAQIACMAEYLQNTPITVEEFQTDHVFDLKISVFAENASASVHLRGTHTNIIEIAKNDAVLFAQDYTAAVGHTGHELLSVSDIVAFANTVKFADIQEVIGRQIRYNTAIAEEGLRGNWGARIGQILLKCYGDTLPNRAKAMAAAGSDARMSGCELPVVINSGSGNQGLTVSLPVIEYAKDLGANEETLYRALVIANLVAIHLKTGIGCLSAYCGATSAAAGMGAGITYLYGGQTKEIAHTIVNALAINSGMICDGAKASCAAKIASAVDASLLGMVMYQEGSQFRAGDGIITKGVENTIRNVGTLAQDGMRETDQEIIRIMLESHT